MEEAEKMAALKKVYADIILNTAKEAAQRIMVSERKAISFQQEIFYTKEEALNMLLRFKNMMDSKIAEVEITSLSQRRRIEELEAQLHEAEDVATDLRGQLKGLQDDLVKMKNNQVHPLDEPIVNVGVASHDDVQADKLNTSEPISLPPLDSGPISKSTSEMKDMPLIQRNVDDCCPMSENATQNELSRDFPVDKCFSGNPDLASIIMRSKEPELYRNGCTQRIRAFERNLLNGSLPLPSQTDDQCSNKKNEQTIKEDETADVTCTIDFPMDSNTISVEKKSIGLEKLLQQDSNCGKVQAVKFSRSSRKRRTRYRNAQVTSCTNKVMQARGASTLSCCNTYPCPDNSMVESGEDPSRIIDEEVLKNSDFHLAPVSSLNTSDGDPRTGCMNGTGSDTDVIKAASVQNTADEDTALLDKSELTRQDSEVTDSSGVPVCKLNLKFVDAPLMKSDSIDEKACEMPDGMLTQAVNDRLLKYTFRRKRKKESLSHADENPSLGNKNTAKKRSGEKQSGASELQKSSLIMESSRDNRRLVQVARQLISLSEKRWWQ